MDNKTFFKNMNDLQIQEAQNRKALQNAYSNAEKEKLDIANLILKIDFDDSNNILIISELKEWAKKIKNKGITNF